MNEHIQNAGRPWGSFIEAVDNAETEDDKLEMLTACDNQLSTSLQHGWTHVELGSWLAHTKQTQYLSRT